MSREAALETFISAVANVLGNETAQAAVAGESAIGDPAGRAAARIRHLETVRQANIERIVGLAAAGLAPAECSETVETGWLARFFECAKDAAGEVEQAIWARLLARELAVLGSVGKRALFILSGMNTWEIEGFVEYGAFSFAFESGARFMFDEDFARREMWTYGRELDITRHLIDIGLLSVDTAWVKAASGRGLRIRYSDNLYELRGSPQPSAVEAGFSYRKFTPVGQELVEALPTKTFLGYARNLIKALNAGRGLNLEPVEAASPDEQAKEIIKSVGYPSFL
jgi:hypothetical protein